MSVVSTGNRERGFTLVELLIYVAMFSLVLTGMYSLFITNTRSYTSQENTMVMTQDLRATMQLMVTEIRMAACDPTEVGGIGFVDNADDRYDTDANSIHFTRDITGGDTDGIDNDNDGSVDETDEVFFGDGDTNDSHEDINYYLYTSNGIQKLGRRTGGAGSPQPVAENITSLTLSYLFEDGDQGTPNETDGDTTNDLADIRSVQVSVTGETADVDPITGQTKQRTVTTWVKVRNLGF